MAANVQHVQRWGNYQQIIEINGKDREKLIDVFENNDADYCTGKYTRH